MQNQAVSAISVEGPVIHQNGGSVSQQEELLVTLVEKRKELLKSIRGINQQIKIGTSLTRKLINLDRENGYSVVFDNPDLFNEQTVYSAVLVGMTKELRNVELAIKQIESGGERRCIDCHRKILEKRLRARPDAIRCVPCLEELEEVRKSARHPSSFYADL